MSRRGQPHAAGRLACRLTTPSAREHAARTRRSCAAQRRGRPAGLRRSAVVLAFFSGGFFDGPRLIAGIGAWVLLALVALAGAGLPRPGRGRARRPGRTRWARRRGRLARDVGAGPRARRGRRSSARCSTCPRSPPRRHRPGRDRRAARVVEPVLAAGALVVIGYGLSGRLLPGVVHLHATARAGGRLEQPLTYWNATGALAALGLVLCARLAGDVTRPRALRIAAAAAAAPLGMGVYLSFSRGALAAWSPASSRSSPSPPPRPAAGRGRRAGRRRAGGAAAGPSGAVRSRRTPATRDAGPDVVLALLAVMRSPPAGAGAAPAAATSTPPRRA